jgi:TatA/E family protein of Tat protein translocase
MFGLGMGEIVLIVIVAIVLFGTDDLPKNLRKMAKGVNEFKKVASDAQRSWMEVKDDVTRTIMHADLENDIRNSGSPAHKTLHEVTHIEAPNPPEELVAGPEFPSVVAVPEAVPRNTQELVDHDHNHDSHQERREEPADTVATPAKSTT